MKKNDKSIMYLIELEILDNQKENLNKLMNALIENTSKENGVLDYHWSINNNTCHIIEHYADSEATLKHLNNFVENFSDEFSKLGEVKRCDVYGQPDNHVKTVLDSFNAKYMDTIGGFTH